MESQSVHAILRENEEQASIRIEGILVQCQFNYDRNLIQIRCPMCFTEITKGGCSRHPDTAGVPTLSTLRLELKDLETDDVISIYPTTEIWAQLPITIDLKRLAAQERDGRLDHSELRTELREQFLQRHAIVDGRFMIREVQGRNASGGEETRRVCSIRASAIDMPVRPIAETVLMLERDFEEIMEVLR